jgi:glycosyltransferase involved in cell wall biosynthesis
MDYQLTVVILTYNESIHVRRAIENVRDWADKIIVLDSYSKDNTAEIAQDLGVEVICRDFDNYKNQREFAINYCKGITEWMFFLDADEYILGELKKEIKASLNHASIDGFYMARRFIFMGRWIKHGGYYPTYLLRLFRPRVATVDQVINEHVEVEGATQMLKHDFVDHNLKGLEFWINKHNQYTTHEKTILMDCKLEKAKTKKLSLSKQVSRKKWLKERVWNHMPLLLRPFIYFPYRYIVRFGFLDGKEGLIFHFLQGFWFWFLVDAKYIEETKKKKESNVCRESLG